MIARVVLVSALLASSIASAQPAPAGSKPAPVGSPSPVAKPAPIPDPVPSPDPNPSPDPVAAPNPCATPPDGNGDDGGARPDPDPAENPPPVPCPDPVVKPDSTPAPHPLPDEEPVRVLSTGRRAAAVALAIVPGLVLRGAGSFHAGEKQGARRLLITAGLGVGLFALGGIPIGATYGSGKVVVPGVHILVAGAGMFVGSWWSDIYAAAGGSRLRGGSRVLPPLELELSTTWQHDAFRGDRFFLTPQVGLRHDRLVVHGAAFLTNSGNALGARAGLGVRLWARRSDDRHPHARHNGSYLEARTALQLLRERDDRVTLATGELEIRGRLDLALLDRSLRGTFFDLGQGLGLETATYKPGGTDVNTILLSRFAWGLYLPRAGGEISIFYDHRRDHLAGGFPAGRAAGFFGSLGAATEIVVNPRWTVVGQLEIGTSWVTTLGLRREVP